MISTILGVAYTLFGMEMAWSDRAIIAVGVFTAGIFLILSMLAIAEVLKLVIDIEHNTRLGAAASRPSMAATAAPATGSMAGADGDGATRPNRLDALDEETAEAALLRGH